MNEANFFEGEQEYSAAGADEEQYAAADFDDEQEDPADNEEEEQPYAVADGYIEAQADLQGYDQSEQFDGDGGQSDYGFVTDAGYGQDLGASQDDGASDFSYGNAWDNDSSALLGQPGTDFEASADSYGYIKDGGYYTADLFGERQGAGFEDFSDTYSRQDGNDNGIDSSGEQQNTSFGSVIDGYSYNYDNSALFDGQQSVDSGSGVDNYGYGQQEDNNGYASTAYTPDGEASYNLMGSQELTGYGQSDNSADYSVANSSWGEWNAFRDGQGGIADDSTGTNPALDETPDIRDPSVSYIGGAASGTTEQSSTTPFAGQIAGRPPVGPNGYPDDQTCKTLNEIEKKYPPSPQQKRREQEKREWDQVLMPGAGGLLGSVAGGGTGAAGGTLAGGPLGGTVGGLAGGAIGGLAGALAGESARQDKWWIIDANDYCRQNGTQAPWTKPENPQSLK